VTLRVAIGPAEVAGTSSALAAGLRTHDVDVELALWSPLPGAFESDRALPRMARYGYAMGAPARRDVLHYQFGRTWVPGFADAAWASLWRRTKIVSFYGDDCRQADVAARHGWPMAHLKDPAADRGIRRRLGRLARLCHAAVTMDLEVASYVTPFFRRVYVTPVPLHERAAPAQAGSTDEKLVVLHAPSDERVKGTPGVRRAVEVLTRRRPVELVLLSGRPHDAVREALSSADVVVDQLHSVSASVFALEAMRAGLPVLSHLDRRGLAPFHDELPIVHVTEDSLADELERMARDPERRRELGEAGRRYAERHSAPNAGASALAIYEHVRTGAPGLYQATAEGILPLPRVAT
jgi:hypothetical protein